MSSSPCEYKVTAEICADYIIRLFASSKSLYPGVRSTLQKHLTSYIFSIMRRSQLDTSVAVAAMTLLFRYKLAIQNSVAHYDNDVYRLFISAYMAATRVVCDLRYHLIFWKRVTNNRFRGKQLEKMEMEMCNALNWDVEVDGEAFAWFKGVLNERAKNHMNACDEVDCVDDVELDRPSSPPGYEELVRGRGASALSASQVGGQFNESEEDVEALARMILDSTRKSGGKNGTVSISKAKGLLAICRKKISDWRLS